MKDKAIIDIISKTYLMSKSILKEEELGISKRNNKALEDYRKVVRKIDNVVNYLDEKDRFIILNEVILGKRGEWYQGLISTPTYYRYRKSAYKNFIHCLNS